MDDPAAIISAVENTITSRRSVREFTAEPVPRSLIERILTVANRAPSRANMQPWKVHVLWGAAKERLSRAILASCQQGKEPSAEYQDYPVKWCSPYINRRRKLGWDLYGMLGIYKGDYAATRAQHLKNYEFFGAPVGLIVGVDKDLAQGSWVDVGMFLQNIAIVACAHGLATCVQGAFAHYHQVIRREIEMEEHVLILCGVAIGHADRNGKLGALVTDREPLDSFAHFHDR